LAPGGLEFLKKLTEIQFFPRCRIATDNHSNGPDERFVTTFALCNKIAPSSGCLQNLFNFLFWFFCAFVKPDKTSVSAREKQAIKPLNFIHREALCIKERLTAENHAIFAAFRKFRGRLSAK
jgi:hypothetical protein